MSDPRKVAVIGLGRMGGAMADHVIKAGHDVAVYDVAAAAMQPRVAAGARAASSAADAAVGAEVVNVVVFDDAQVVATLTGPDGMFTVLPRDAVVCVHTTVSIDTMHELHALAEPHGVVVLDAGISGGEPGAAKGTLLTMVGGPARAVERARPVMDAFSKEIIHAGPLGAGMALKLARNAAGYMMMAATHEAMVLAHNSGIDMEVLRHTIADTGVLDQALAPFFFGAPTSEPTDASDPMYTILDHTNRLAGKDLDQALALAARIGGSVPVIETVRACFHDVVRL